MEEAKEALVCKKRYKSAIQDPAELPYETTKCGALVQSSEISYFWKDVTCDDCLALKDQ